MKNTLLYVGILLSVLFLTSCAHKKGRKLPPQARNLLPPQLRNLSNEQLEDLGNDAQHLQHFAVLNGLNNLNGLNGLNGIDPRTLQGANFEGVPLSPFWKKALESAGTPGVFTPEDERQLNQDVVPHWKMDHSDSSDLATVRTVSDAIQHRGSDTH